MSEKKKPVKPPVPEGDGMNYKMLFDESVKTIDSLGKTLEMRRTGIHIAIERLAAYHAGVADRGVTDEDRRCCTLLDGILSPIFAAEAGRLRVIPAAQKGGAS